jgi:hypothetical protein
MELVGWLVGWLVDWSVAHSADSLVGWLVGRSAGRLVSWSVGRLSNPELCFRFDILIAVRQGDCLVGRRCHSEDRRAMFFLNTNKNVPNYTASIKYHSIHFRVHKNRVASLLKSPLT